MATKGKGRLCSLPFLIVNNFINNTHFSITNCYNLGGMEELNGTENPSLKDIIVGDSRNGRAYALGKDINIQGTVYTISGIYKDTNAYVEEGVTKYDIYVSSNGKEQLFKTVVNQPVIVTYKL